MFKSSVLLGTAVVKVQSSSGALSYARALIDAGAEVTLVAESLIQRFKLPRISLSIPICGIGNVKSYTIGSSNLIITSRIMNFHIQSMLTYYLD